MDDWISDLELELQDVEVDRLPLEIVLILLILALIAAYLCLRRRKISVKRDVPIQTFLNKMNGDWALAPRAQAFLYTFKIEKYSINYIKDKTFCFVAVYSGLSSKHSLLCSMLQYVSSLLECFQLAILLVESAVVLWLPWVNTIYMEILFSTLHQGKYTGIRESFSNTQ